MKIPHEGNRAPAADPTVDFNKKHKNPNGNLEGFRRAPASLFIRSLLDSLGYRKPANQELLCNDALFKLSVASAPLGKEVDEFNLL
ncbi:hypothetical protein PHLCEN_2v12939 [Hermanssonia centrifuga]|uniref:Uncharacterized protein n=1 Tax=Hermanssonia centrifuga TaxID=98765 RepID=A0A2R6NFM3_9APHY|nr:hypothetical protein PHLCEN_2v12939 [Hermanssonia centrifuga]